MKLKRLLLWLVILTVAATFISCGEQEVYRTVKFDSNGGTAQQSVAIEDGSTISKPKDPEWVGYTFLGWYLGETLWDFENNSVTADITLKAKWERIKYSVSFDTDGGTAVDSQSIGLGDHASRPKKPAKDGCVFVGWYVGDVAFDFEKTPIMSDTVVKAKWDRISYTVTYDANGGNKTPAQKVMHGDLATPPVAPTMANHRFIGWYFGDMLWDFTANKITSDITLVARWEDEVLTHEVKFLTINNALYDTRYVEDGTLLQAPTPPEDKHNLFIGWYLGEVEFDFANTPITESITLTARWRERKGFVIKFVTGDGNSPVADQFVIEGDLITEPIYSQGGSNIKWMYNGKIWDFKTPPTCDMTLTARKSFLITFNTDGEIEIPDQIVMEGDLIIEPSIYLENLGVEGWEYDSQLWDFSVPPTEDMELFVRWYIELPMHPF